MADEAKVEAAKTAAPAAKPEVKSPFMVTGCAGCPFTITGAGFGTEDGTVLFGSSVAEVTSWRDDRIKGVMPRNAKRGMVTVRMAGEETREQVGSF